MKDYWSIPGWKSAPQGLPCIAFKKYDGSNIRAEWSKKNGFYKYGSRNVLLDRNQPFIGSSIDLFEKKYAEDIDKVFRNNKNMPVFDQAVVFMEFYGPSSFAGQHVENEEKSLTIIDVNLHKRGIVIPRDFVRWFENLPIAEVVYRGNLNQSFIEDVKNGVYGYGEGIVAKGVKPGKKEQHGLWMAKVKTKAWMVKLREFAANNVNLQRMYEDNLREQEDLK